MESWLLDFFVLHDQAMQKFNTRIPIVGVMGSGTKAHQDKAQLVGRWLAEAGVHLLTGGGGGIMASVSRAFHEVSSRRGLVLGIIPGEATPRGYATYNGYPNQWVEVPIFTHLPYSGLRGTDILSRNHINVLSSDVIIALPGSAGTASEIILAKLYNKPLIAYLSDPSDIESLPPSTPFETDFKNIKKFVRQVLDYF